MSGAGVPGDAAPALHDQIGPLSWLVGVWEGVGVGGYPGITDFQFGQHLAISHDGRPLLMHHSRSWLLEPATGTPGRPLAAEDGFWRLPGEQAELVLAHGAGFVEIWLGGLTAQSVELATDVVARTSSAKEVTAGRRLYGLVDGDLLWSYDMSAVGQQMQPHLSARLRRVG